MTDDHEKKKSNVTYISQRFVEFFSSLLMNWNYDHPVWWNGFVAIHLKGFIMFYQMIYKMLWYVVYVRIWVTEENYILTIIILFIARTFVYKILLIPMSPLFLCKNVATMIMECFKYLFIEINVGRNLLDFWFKIFETNFEEFRIMLKLKFDNRHFLLNFWSWNLE